MTYLLIGLNNGSECLVEFPDRDLVLGDSGALKSDGNGLSWGDWEINGVNSGVGTGDNAGKSRATLAEFPGKILAADNQSGSTVVHGGGISSSDGTGTVSEEGRLKSRELIETEVVEALIPLNDGVSLLTLDCNRDNLLGELVLLPGRLGTLVRLDGILVLVLARNIVLLGRLLSTDTHVELVVDIPETVLDETILHLEIAEWRQLAGTGEIVGDTGHVLHSTSNLSLGKAKLDVLGGKGHCFKTRGADLVHSHGLNALGETSKDGRLTSRSLAH